MARRDRGRSGNKPPTRSTDKPPIRISHAERDDARQETEISLQELHLAEFKISHGHVSISASPFDRIHKHFEDNSRFLGLIIEALYRRNISIGIYIDELGSYVARAIFEDRKTAIRFGDLVKSRIIELERNIRYDDGVPTSKKPPSVLPSAAPKLYTSDYHGEASDFLLEVWGDYVKAGIIFQHDLRDLDPSLMKALDNEYSNRRDELRKLVPPKEVETDRLLMQIGVPSDSPARAQLASALRKAGVRVKALKNTL